MGITKFGTGEILPDEGDNQKIASTNFTEKDVVELQVENEQADAE